MLAYLCISTEPQSSLVRKVEILDKFGLTDEEIGKVCGCSKQVVANSRFKRKRAK
jgi:hypothetical protein